MTETRHVSGCAPRMETHSGVRPGSAAEQGIRRHLVAPLLLTIVPDLKICSALDSGAMTVSQFWIYMIAIMVSPLIAVQVSEFLNKRKESRGRRVGIFKTLMGTRASRLSADHVQALNTIDIEFHGKDKRSRQVLEAWKAYLNHLNTRLPPRCGSAAAMTCSSSCSSPWLKASATPWTRRRFGRPRTSPLPTDDMRRNRRASALAFLNSSRASARSR
jgi:hypothetical protein